MIIRTVLRGGDASCRCPHRAPPVEMIITTRKRAFHFEDFFFIIFLYYSREMELQTRITSVAASFIRHSYRKAKPEGKRTKHGKGIILSLFFVIFIAPPDTSPHYFKPETWDTWWDTKLNQKIIRCWQTKFPMCVRCVWGLHQTVDTDTCLGKIWVG